MKETHPDRSGCVSTVDQFHRVQIAYEFLQQNKSKLRTTSSMKFKEKKKKNVPKTAPAPAPAPPCSSKEQVPRAREQVVREAAAGGVSHSQHHQHQGDTFADDDGMPPLKPYTFCTLRQDNAAMIDRMEQLAQQRAAIELQRVDLRRSMDVGLKMTAEMIKSAMAPRGRGRVCAKGMLKRGGCTPVSPKNRINAPTVS